MILFVIMMMIALHDFRLHDTDEDDVDNSWIKHASTIYDAVEISGRTDHPMNKPILGVG